MFKEVEDHILFLPSVQLLVVGYEKRTHYKTVNINRHNTRSITGWYHIRHGTDAYN